MPIIDSLNDVENFLTLTNGEMADLPTMETRGVSIKACAEVGEFSAMIYTLQCVSKGIMPDFPNIVGFVASFSMMLGIELERRGVLNED